MSTPHMRIFDENWVELNGDDIPYHLRMDAPALGFCNRCRRKTWSVDNLDTEDRMPQPDGNPCGGRFIRWEIKP